MVDGVTPGSSPEQALTRGHRQETAAVLFRSPAPFMVQHSLKYRLYHLLPFMRWKHLVNRDSTRADLLAGLSGALIVLPQGVAFATIAGMPPEFGLYAAMLPAIVAALFGSSWHLVSGPTTAISIAVFAAISPLAEPGSPQFISMVLTLTFLTGVFQLILGLARMGCWSISSRTRW